ncbi:MAG: MarR family transcriptional regulator [Deltaproteobacteria bacterium]|nr:MarR family transcriptional regulator [Deltaproteobacteria bacterium]MBW1846731.1 MarR family transcriptional regulator [Deltaproteobacteria bacterium]MBW2180397.1 MarR family transcriptional regulator [Deltaproteobacteria bacterium]
MSKITTQQLREFQDLIEKVFQCCQDRIQYQSKKFNLPDAELRCIMLFGEERYLTPKGIAQKMKVVKSRVSKIILGLEKKDLIRRLKDPEDSRGYLLTITPSGKQKVKEIQKFYDEVHYEVLAQMTSGQRNVLLNNLNLLKSCMEAGRELMN